MKRFFNRQQPSYTHALNSFFLITSALSASAVSMTAQAQEGFAIEEVVVTARKREESLQEVPVSVSAFSSESLKALGVNNIKDLDGIVPGLNMGGGGNGSKGDSNPYIRGIGQRETKVTVDSAVGTYIDGVYIGRASGALMDAVDVQSIQVLRGPQGTLFGKNTTGGAIVMTTVKPGPDFGGHVDGTVGNYGRMNASGAINLPITDTLSSRFTVASTNSDGYTENTIDGENWSDDGRLMGIAQLRWEPTDSLVTDLLYSQTKTEQNPRGQSCRSFADEFPTETGLETIYNINSGPDAVQQACREGGADLDVDEFQSEQAGNSNIFRQGVYEVDTAMLSLTVDWNLGPVMGLDDFSIKSITAGRTTEQKADEDIDAMGIALTGRLAPQSNETDQYSQEFQFTGSALDNRLDFTVGLFAFYEETDNDMLQDYAAYLENTTTPNAILLVRSELSERETENEAFAAFSQLTYDITDRIEFTLGIRYTKEDRTTTYREADVYTPSIGNGDYLCSSNPLDPDGTPCGTPTNDNPLHQFTEPGGVPFNQWQYGYDVSGDGDIQEAEVGLFGKDSKNRSDDDWNPMASIKFLASDNILDTLNLDDAMTFFTYSTGFRSGGVVVSVLDQDNNGIKDLDTFDPEFVQNYEIGLKLDALDKRLRTNFAIFYTEYEDIQVTTVIPDPNSFNLPLPAIENAGEAEIKGIEGEIVYLPIESLRFTASFAWTDAEYIEYLVDVPDPSDSTNTIEIDRSDEPMPRVADWTGFLAIDYFIYTESLGTIIPSVSGRYIGEIYHGFDRASFEVEDDLTAPETYFLDARLTWQFPDNRTTITAWGKNLTDEDDYLVGGVPLVSVARTTGTIYGEPRTYGLDISYTFGN